MQAPTPLRAEICAEAARRIEEAALDVLGFSIRVTPVPARAPFVMSLRRDVDRPLNVTQLREQLQWQSDAGVPATWFFKPDTYSDETARLAAAQDDDLGWHVCHVEVSDDGFARQLTHAFPAFKLGSSFHGGQDSSYWRGRASLDAVATSGYDFSERLTDWLPHPEIDPPTGLVLTHIALKVESQPDWVPAHEALIRAYRGHMIIESHPDRFTAELAQRIRDWKAKGATIRRIADHVCAVREAYHAQGRLSGNDGRRRLVFESPAPCGVEIVVPRSTGQTQVIVGGRQADASVDGDVLRINENLPAAEPQVVF